MKVIGIVAEYNPLHNGHAYQIRYAKDVLKADHIIIAMSGPFTQRGTPALFDKYTRASHALSCGADLVLELPVVYATASAEIFADAAVALLASTGVVTHLLFGCETPDLQGLTTLADILNHEPDWYRQELRKHMALGESMPKARAAALSVKTDASILNTPNNILAVEYIRSIQRRNLPLIPVPLQREGNGYHDPCISSGFASATAIRNAIASDSPEEILSQIPSDAKDSFTAHIQEKNYLLANDISPFLHMALLQQKDYSNFFDCNTALSQRIHSALPSYKDPASFCLSLKTKDVTYSRISRSLCHILLDIKKGQVPLSSDTPYLRMLGLSKTHSDLLSQIKKNGTAPLIASPKEKHALSSGEAQLLLEKDIFAADLYRSALTAKTKKIYPTEYTRRFLIQ